MKTASKVGHTPGPWHTSNWPSSDFAEGATPCIFGATGSPLIAKVWHGKSSLSGRRMVSIEAAEANAKLMAAAPELADALIEMRVGLAAAMRVMAKHDLAEEFIDHVKASGVPDGAGVRAESALKKAGKL